MSRLLLHACCAPCSVAVIDELRQSSDVTVLFYNPNIFPLAEYEKRKAEVVRVCAGWGVSMVDLDYRPEEWESACGGGAGDKERGPRCERCLRLRLDRAAAYAKENGFDAFATSLSGGRQKSSVMVNVVGRAAGESRGIAFLDTDWKKGGRTERAAALIREMNIYRQDYCGCRISLAARRSRAGVNSPKNTPLLAEFVKGKNWDDDFGYHPVWNKEIEKWLDLIKRKSPDYYKRKSNDVATKEKRASFLAECMVAYYLHNQGYEIQEFEKKAGNKKTPDMFLNDQSGKDWYAEVKGPTWQGTVVKEMGVEGSRPRLAQPKYIRDDGGVVDFSDLIAGAVIKSSGQFSVGKNNMLVIAPDERFPVTDWARMVGEKKISEIVSKNDAESKISRVIILETGLFAGSSEVEYDAVDVLISGGE